MASFAAPLSSGAVVSAAFGSSSTSSSSSSSSSPSPTQIAEAITAFAEWARNSLDSVRPQLEELSYALLLNCFLELLIAHHDGSTTSISSTGGGSPFALGRALLSAQRTRVATIHQTEISSLLIITDPSTQLFRGVVSKDPRARLEALRGLKSLPPPASSSSAPAATSSSTAGNLAVPTDGHVLARLADPTQRIRVAMSPMAQQLAIDYLMRSRSTFLLGKLNERVSIVLSEDPAVLNNVAASGLALPVLDVAAGMARAADRVAAAAADVAGAAGGKGGRGGGGAAAGSAAGGGAAAAASDIARIFQWGSPAAPTSVYCGSSVARATIPWPDYRSTAYGRALLSAAADEGESEGQGLNASSAAALSSSSSSSPAAAMNMAEEEGGAAGSATAPAVRTALIAGAEDSLLCVAGAWLPRTGPRKGVRFEGAVASGFADGTLKVWVEATVDGARLSVCCQSTPSSSASQAAVTAAAVSPCLQYALSGHADGTVRLWHVGRTFAVDGPGGVVGRIKAAAVSTTVELISPVAIYEGHNGMPVWTLSFAPFASNVFASGARDGCGYLWSTGASEAQRAFAGHSGDISSLAFHPNGLYVITASQDRTLRVWEAATGDCIRVLAGHAARISCVAVSPSGRFFASGDEAGEVRLWDGPTASSIAAWRGHGDAAAINAVSFAPDGRKVLSASSGAVAASVPGRKESAPRSSATVAAVGKREGRICVWNVEDAVGLFERSGAGQWTTANAAGSGGGRAGAAKGSKRFADTAESRVRDLLGVVHLPGGPVKVHALSPTRRNASRNDGGNEVEMVVAGQDLSG